MLVNKDGVNVILDVRFVWARGSALAANTAAFVLRHARSERHQRFLQVRFYAALPSCCCAHFYILLKNERFLVAQP